MGLHVGLFSIPTTFSLGSDDDEIAGLVSAFVAFVAFADAVGDEKAPTNDKVVWSLTSFRLVLSNTEKSAMLSSPSENRLVSVISYHEPDFEVTKGLNKDEVLG